MAASEHRKQTCGLSAIEALRGSFEALDDRCDAKDTDLVFLRGLMDSKVINSLVKVHEKIEGERSNGEGLRGADSGETTQLIRDVKKMCNILSVRDRNAQELNYLLNNPHIEALAEAHDNVVCKAYEEPEFIEESYEMETFIGDDGTEIPANAIRMVGIRKINDQPLGMTVTVEDDMVVIARIMSGGLIDKQGLLHVNDVILEVNGQEIHSPEQLQEQIRKSKGSVTFKVLPSTNDTVSHEKIYVRTLYNYDPIHDTLLPCKELGLPFKMHDILEVLNQDDPNWWQSRGVEYPKGHAGLVPSQELEERRQAFVPPEFDHATRTSICGTKIRRNKKTEMYQLQANSEFDKADLVLYEEVCQRRGFERKTLVLIGAQGVGKRSIKTRLIAYDSNRFATALPHTSRPIREGEIDGKTYHFVKREIMEKDITDNKYLEYGEFQDHLYGTKLESIRAIIRSGRMCIIDCNPQCLKLLRTSEYKPYIVFIGAAPIEQLRYMNEWGRNNHGIGGRSLTFDRALGRQNSRRMRSLRSLQSFYEDEDLQITVEESARVLRLYQKYFDMIIVNNNFEKTCEQLRDAVEALITEPQWIPITWVNSDD